MTFLEEYGWFFSLLANFREWFFVAGVGLILLVPWVDKSRVIFICLTAAILLAHFWTIFPYLKMARKHESVNVEQKTIDVFLGNLNSQNQTKSLLINYLKDKKPEIVFLVELNSSWVNEVKTLESIYPFAKAIVREGNFGMAVLSKTPLETENVYVDRVNMIPALFLRTQSAIGALNLVLLHAHPPIGSYGTLIRNQYLDVLSRRIVDLSSPALVCGDFNATPWTSVFQKFVRNSELKHNKSYLFPGTWPAISFLPKLPLDHCLSRGLKVSKYIKGPDIGSDHWPLLVQISKPERSVTPNSD